LRAFQDAEHAVLRDPWPDAPRLAFADAVAATDRDRARVIRDEITVLRARRAGVMHHLREQDAIVPFRSSLRFAQRDAFADLIPPGDLHHWVGVGRGFVEVASAPAGWLLDHAPDLFARAPVLDLHVTGLAEQVDAFFEAPWLSRIRTLRLAGNGLGDAAVRRIAASVFLGRLRWLDLAANRIGPPGLDALATTTMLPSLRFVQIEGNPVPDPNYVTDMQEAWEGGAMPTNASAAFLARHPGCPWIGRYASDKPPLPGALQDAAGGLLP
jgi:hypothetical protein